ncbi:hypothetical protein BD626DRAFT_485868 [Schizophyllum amplum]|uniref:Uncharacterized protein n=1 Tax=Schizophyllum amplum TaxID=97359 RepID=A0A550CM20_9AGAR|nr:hypothetical protein BD626DRAFT_485868 [Auriculariopsis ampla]
MDVQPGPHPLNPALPLDVITRIADYLLAFRNDLNSAIIKYGDIDDDIKKSQAAAAALAGSRALRQHINPMLYQSPRFETVEQMYLFCRTIGRDRGYHVPRNRDADGLTPMVRRLILTPRMGSGRRVFGLPSIEKRQVDHFFLECLEQCTWITSVVVPFERSREIHEKVMLRSSRVVELGLCAKNNMDYHFLDLDALDRFMNVAGPGGAPMLSTKIKHLSLDNYSYAPGRSYSGPVDIPLESLSLHAGNLSAQSLSRLLHFSTNTLTSLSIDFAGHEPGLHITTNAFTHAIEHIAHLQDLTILGYPHLRRVERVIIQTAGLLDQLSVQLPELRSLEFDDDLATKALLENAPLSLQSLYIIRPTSIKPSDLPLLSAQAARRQLSLRKVVVAWREEDVAEWQRFGTAVTSLLAIQGIQLFSATARSS